jgi:hypothetical protein
MRMLRRFRQNVLHNAASFLAGTLIFFQNYLHFHARPDILPVLPVHGKASFVDDEPPSDSRRCSRQFNYQPYLEFPQWCKRLAGKNCGLLAGYYLLERWKAGITRLRLALDYTVKS